MLVARVRDVSRWPGLPGADLWPWDLSSGQYQVSGLTANMWTHHIITAALLLASASAFKIDNNGEKVCTLEKSATNGPECFYEPECWDVCKDVMVEVSNILTSMMIRFIKSNTRSVDQSRRSSVTRSPSPTAPSSRRRSVAQCMMWSMLMSVRPMTRRCARIRWRATVIFCWRLSAAQSKIIN